MIKVKCKARSIELSLPQRCAAHIASLTDIRESVAIGRCAVKEALAGAYGCMVGFKRTSNSPYTVEIVTVPVDTVANEVRFVPSSFINEAGNGVTEECIAYLRPLIEGEVKPVYEYGMPKHFVL